MISLWFFLQTNDKLVRDGNSPSGYFCFSVNHKQALQRHIFERHMPMTFTISIQQFLMCDDVLNYLTRRLHSLPGYQTASYLVLTHIKKSICRFLARQNAVFRCGL